MATFKISVPERNFKKYSMETVTMIANIIDQLKTENFKQEKMVEYAAITYSDEGAPDELEALFTAMAHGLPLEPMIDYIVNRIIGDDLNEL